MGCAENLHPTETELRMQASIHRHPESWILFCQGSPLPQDQNWDSLCTQNLHNMQSTITNPQAKFYVIEKGKHPWLWKLWQGSPTKKIQSSLIHQE